MESKRRKKLPPKVKVVHLITLLELGGAQGNTIHTVRTLNPQKFEAYLWAGRGAFHDKELIREYARSGRFHFIKNLVRPINPLRDIVVIFELWKKLRTLKPQILHTHSSKAGIVGRISGWLAGVPVIIHTFHGFGFNSQQFFGTRLLYIILERITAHFCQKLIFVSHSNERTARSLGIGEKRQYQLIRSGVPIRSIAKRGKATSKKRLKKKLGIPFHHRVITTIGAFKPQKNLSDFIQMAHEIKSSRKNMSFLIIGDGVQRPDIEKKIRALGLKKEVLLAGWRRDTPELLGFSDLFVMTSLWEGLPRALVEAMILGVPPICYKTDGVSDLLMAQKNLIVRQGDLAALIRKVSYLLENDSKRRQISKSLPKQIGKEFDIDYMVRQQEVLYQKCLSKIK